MATGLAYCTLHAIAYNRALDPVCPQCIMGRVFPLPEQREFQGEGAAVKSPPVLGAVIGPATPDGVITP